MLTCIILKRWIFFIKTYLSFNAKFALVNYWIWKVSSYVLPLWLSMNYPYLFIFMFNKEVIAILVLWWCMFVGCFFCFLGDFCFAFLVYVCIYSEVVFEILVIVSYVFVDIWIVLCWYSVSKSLCTCLAGVLKFL